MTTNISETISTALDSVGITDTPVGYESAVAAVERALAEREYTITETILAKVAEYDLSDSDDALAARILADAGLASRPAPEPEPEPEPEHGADAEPLSVEDRLHLVETALSSQAEVQASIAAALTKLTGLAERLVPGSTAE